MVIMDISTLVLQISRIVVPLLLSVSILLFILGFSSRKNRDKQQEQTNFEALLGDIGVSEVEELLELDEDKKIRKLSGLSSWSKHWLTLYVGSGREVGEDLKFPGKQVLWLTILGGAVGLVFARLVGLILGAAAVPVLIHSILTSKTQKRNALMDSQLLSLAQSMEQNIASGAIPTSAFLRSVDDVPHPLRQEMDKVRESVKSGTPFTEALDTFAARHDSREMKFFASAMTVSIEQGADLVPQLKVIVDKLEKRKHVRETISELLATMSMALYVVGGSVPIALLVSSSGLLTAGLPEEMQKGTSSILGVWASSPTGIIVLLAIIALWAGGLFMVIRSINSVKKF